MVKRESGLLSADDAMPFPKAYGVCTRGKRVELLPKGISALCKMKVSSETFSSNWRRRREATASLNGVLQHFLICSLKQRCTCSAPNVFLLLFGMIDPPHSALPPDMEAGEPLAQTGPVSFSQWE